MSRTGGTVPVAGSASHSPTYPAGDWRTWEVADQRFCDQRPDVLIRCAAGASTTITGEAPADPFCANIGSFWTLATFDGISRTAKCFRDPDVGPKTGRDYLQSASIRETCPSK